MGEGQELTKAWYLRPAEPVWEEERQTLLDMNKVTDINIFPISHKYFYRNLIFLGAAQQEHAGSEGVSGTHSTL